MRCAEELDQGESGELTAALGINRGRLVEKTICLSQILFEFFTGTEARDPVRLNLDLFAGLRIAAFARIPLGADESAETDQANLFPFFHAFLRDFEGSLDDALAIRLRHLRLGRDFCDEFILIHLAS